MEPTDLSVPFETEKYLFSEGPYKMFTRAIRDKKPLLISLRNNHKMIAIPRAVDKHLNMVLEHVREMWSENGQSKERTVNKMFIRGDQVIVVAVV